MVMDDALSKVYVANVRIGCPFYFSDMNGSTQAEFLHAFREGKAVYVIAEEDIEVPEYLARAKRVFRCSRGTSIGGYLAEIMDEENTGNVMVI